MENMTGIIRIGQLAEKSRHQRGPQLPIFKAERYAAVPMVFLRTFDNMTVSLGWGLIAGHKKGGDTVT